MFKISIDKNAYRKMTDLGHQIKFDQILKDIEKRFGGLDISVEELNNSGMSITNFDKNDERHIHSLKDLYCWSKILNLSLQPILVNGNNIGRSLNFLYFDNTTNRIILEKDINLDENLIKLLHELTNKYKFEVEYEFDKDGFRCDYPSDDNILSGERQYASLTKARRNVETRELYKGNGEYEYF